MKISEWFWTRMGFGVVAIAAGFIWFMIFFPVITIINPDASGSAAAKVFIAVFLLVSFINEKLIGTAGLGAIYALLGMISGFFAEGGSAIELQWSKYSKELCVCFIAGVVSVIAIMMLRFFCC